MVAEARYKDRPRRGEGCRAWLDSGTNGHLATSELVGQMGLRVTEEKRVGSKEIQTAQEGQKLSVLGQVNVGGLIGEMNVAPTASCNLLSIGKLQDKNVRITFMEVNKGGECILEKNNTILMKISRDSHTKMHDVDVRELIDIQDDVAYMARQPRASVSGELLRRSKEDLRRLKDKVMRLHKTLGHVHFRAMASAIRDGTLMGTGLTYRDVMVVAKHNDCVACGLAKWSAPNAGPSLSSHPASPLHTVSVDGLGPYKPVAMGGFTRAILATCGTTLFQMGKLIKKYNARELVGFLKDVLGLAQRYKFIIRLWLVVMSRVKTSCLDKIGKGHVNFGLFETISAGTQKSFKLTNTGLCLFSMISG